MIIVYRDKDKIKNFTIISKRKKGVLPDGVLPEVAENEDILAIKNVDEVEGTVFMRNPNNIAIQYSTNGSEFNEYTTATEIPINPSEKVYFKWSDVISSSNNNTALVSSSVKYKAYGELKKGNEQYAYYYMFKNERNLIDASELQLTSTTLQNACYYYMFYGCTSLTTAPALPATELQSYCYSGMFSGCTSLTTAPSLPATELQSSCYSGMFRGCTSLTQAPQLPATELAYSCYNGMFHSCTSLTTAPALPATELQSYCYSYMFDSCTSLTTAPSLPATILGVQCYESMFRGCTSLTTAPALPATELQSSCYSGMFRGCTSLTQAPQLPATELAYSCYNGMFYDCTSLNYVKHHIVSWNTSYTSNWLNNVSATGTVECPLNSTIPSNDASGIPTGWTRVNVDENGNVIPDEPSLPEVAENEDILAIENVDTVEGTVFMNNPNNRQIQYSTNGSEFDDYTTESIIRIGVGKKVYFKWNMSLGNASAPTTLVNSSVKYKVYGELKKGNYEDAYLYMFYNQTNLIDASELNLLATSLENECYRSMFEGCTSLTTAPELPATELERDSYWKMFRDCTSLTTAPELPATELAEDSYGFMFFGCTSLNYVKHNITEWDSAKTNKWLEGVASSGTVECPANSTIPSDSSSGIPTGWTRVAIE